MTRTRAAVAWSLVELGARQGLPFIATIVLARLVTPSAFGLVALMQLVTMLATVLCDAGFISALIQKRDVDARDEAGVFAFNAIAGLVLGVAIGLAGPAFAAFFDAPPLASLAWATGANVFVAALVLVPAARLARTLDFRTQAYAALIGALAGAAAAIVLGYFGAGIWALVAQMLVTTVFGAVALWALRPWRPSVAPSMAPLREMWPYARPTLLSRASDLLFGRVHTIAIAKVHGAAPLGLYARAEAVPQMSTSVIGGVTGRVLFALFSRQATDRDVLVDSVDRWQEVLLFANAPLMIGAAVLPAPLLFVLFGPQWQAAAAVLAPLAIAGLLWPLHSTSVQALMAAGRADVVLRLELVKKSAVVVLVLASVPFGLVAVAWAQVAIGVVAWLANAAALHAITGNRLSTQVRALAAFLVAGLAMAAAMVFVHGVLIDFPPIVALAAAWVVGLAVYLVVCRALRPRLVETIRLGLSEFPRTIRRF